MLYWLLLLLWQSSDEDEMEAILDTDEPGFNPDDLPDPEGGYGKTEDSDEDEEDSDEDEESSEEEDQDG